MKKIKNQIIIGTAIFIILAASTALIYKNMTQLKYVRANAPISSDKEFDKGSKIELKSLTDLQKKTLFKLGKVWGFAKYYHPKVATGKINWDYDLFRIMPKLLVLKSDKEVDKLLCKWINDLGTLQKGTSEKSGAEVIIKADTNWIRDTKFISTDLSKLLVKIQASDRAKSNYYVGYEEYVHNPNFKNEKIYATMNYKDEGYKLLSLFRYWNAIEYFLPYRDIMDKSWDTVLKDFIPLMVKCNDDLSYKLTISDLIGRVQDGHANMDPKDKTFNKFLGNNIAPLKLKMVEGKVVVVEKWDQLSSDANVKVGDVILKIGGRDVSDLLKEKLRYMPMANKVSYRTRFLSLLLRTNDEYLDVSMQRDKDIINEKIKCSKDLTITDQIFSNKHISSHKMSDGNVGYIYAANLGDNQIDSIMEEFKNTKGLIIDLRCYPSTFLPFALGKYIVPKPTKFVKITNSNAQTPGEFTTAKFVEVGENYSKLYEGKVIIMINDDAQSSAEYTTMALKVAPKATVIGSNTIGADGNVSYITLPGNINTYFTGTGIYYPDGGQTQRIGILPDIEIRPTIEGLRNGRDELLEKAVELINK